MSRTRAPSCWLVILLLAGIVFPAAGAAACCAPGGDDAGETCVESCAASCAGCCDDDRGAPGDHDEPLDDGDASEGCCDDARTCCGVAQPVLTSRGTTSLEAAGPAGVLRLAPFGVTASDASLDLLRPPQF